MKKPTEPLRLFWGENHALKPKIVQKVIIHALHESEKVIHLYPADLYYETQKLLSKKYQLSPNSILLQNGIESLLVAIFRAFIAEGDEVITLLPTFTHYEYNVTLLRGTITPIPVKLHYFLDAQDILNKVTNKTKVICLAFPNTTTGLYHVTSAGVKKILDNFSGLVVIDECYFGLGTETVLPLVKKYSNLVVLRGASKSWGLAGIRVGFAFANPEVIKKINTHSVHLANDPIAASSLLVLNSILPHSKILEENFIMFKEAFIKKLRTINNIQVHPSASTFIPITLNSKISLKNIVKALERHDILIKDTSGFGFLLLGIPPREYWEYMFDVIEKVLLGKQL